MVAIMLGIVFAPFVSVPAYWLAMLINSCGRKQGWGENKDTHNSDS